MILNSFLAFNLLFLGVNNRLSMLIQISVNRYLYILYTISVQNCTNADHRQSFKEQQKVDIKRKKMLCKVPQNIMLYSKFGYIM